MQKGAAQSAYALEKFNHIIYGSTDNLAKTGLTVWAYCCGGGGGGERGTLHTLADRFMHGQ